DDHRVGDAVDVGVGEALPQVVLLDVGEDEHRPAGRVDGALGPAPREDAHRVVVVVHRQRQLLQVVGALHARGGLADLLYRGEEKTNQDGNNSDDDQQLDQREGHAAAWTVNNTDHGKISWIRESRVR